MTDDLVKRLRDLADCAVDVAPYETMLQAAHRIEILGMRIREFEQTLDTLQSDVRDAVKMWRYANPGNDVKWPDHANLCGWLMDKAKQDAERIEQLEEALGALWWGVGENGAPDELLEKTKDALKGTKYD
jgi:hypothetical protein